MTALDLACGLARRFEGLELVAYYDAAGFPTQGYGRLLSRDKRLALPPPIDEATAEAWLREDMGAALRRTDALCLRLHNRIGARAALADFAFNLGSAALARSTLLRLANAGDDEGAARQFALWVYAGGRRLKGLERRRRAEADLYLDGLSP